MTVQSVLRENNENKGALSRTARALRTPEGISTTEYGSRRMQVQGSLMTREGDDYRHGSHSKKGISVNSNFAHIRCIIRIG